MNSTPLSVSDQLAEHIRALIVQAGGWLPFDAFMQAALYAPGLGYYTNGLPKFGSLGAAGSAGSVSTTQGSDFVTAPELSAVFGQCLAQQIAQVLQATRTACVYEFGAGSGALALQICEHLDQTKCRLEQYFIVEISSELRARQQDALKAYAGRITWLDALPHEMQGVAIGNEVLDAMPVKLLNRLQGQWHERGVVCEALAQNVAPVSGSALATPPAFSWADRPTALRPPTDIVGEHDYLTEIHSLQEAFLSTLAQHLSLGAAFFIDYGFSEAEYYHPQRHMGTLMTHQLHQSGTDPLGQVGLRDVTAHVNFTGCAVAAQDAGLDVLGYITQGRFLLNSGYLELAGKLAPLPRGASAKLVTEHEMGELFKVLALGKGLDSSVDLIGFMQGDRSHTL